MSTGGVIALAIGSALLVVAVIASGYFGWRTFVRRRIVMLVAKSEALAGVRDALLGVMTRLSSTTDEQFGEFANDADHPERGVFSEVADRASILRTELDTISLPHALIPIAERLADSAHLLAEGARRVIEADGEQQMIAATTAIEPDMAVRYQREGILSLRTVVELNGIDDPSVYGGGLYL